MDRLPDDLKEWQDALEDRDNAKHAYQSYAGNDMRVAAVLCGVWLETATRVDMLRMEHHESQRIKFAADFADRPTTGHWAVSTGSIPEVAQSIGSPEESESPDLVTGSYGIYSEDEYFDNRERLRGIK